MEVVFIVVIVVILVVVVVIILVVVVTVAYIICISIATLASIDNYYTPYKYNISIYHIHYSISIRLTMIQLARSPVADTSSAPSTVRGTWWPRIIAKLSDEEKTELPGR